MKSIIYGIYRISNTIDDRIYIGSSNDINIRFYHHKYELEKNIHANGHLQNFSNKYGIDKLVFEAIEPCDLKLLRIREQWYLDNVIRWGYDFNIARNVERTNLGLKMSDAQKLKMSIAKKGKKQSPEHAAKSRLSAVGFKHTQAFKDICSKTHKGKIVSNETKEKMSKKVNQYTLEGVYIKTWKSISSVKEEGKIVTSHITACCRGKINSIGGFMWRYFEGNTNNIKPYKYTGSKEVLLVDLENNTIKEYSSMKEAAKDLELSITTIRTRCNTTLNNQKNKPYLQFKN